MFDDPVPKLLSQADRVPYFAALSVRISIMFTKAEQERTAPIRNDWMVIHNG